MTAGALDSKKAVFQQSAMQVCLKLCLDVGRKRPTFTQHLFDEAGVKVGHELVPQLVLGSVALVVLYTRQQRGVAAEPGSEHGNLLDGFDCCSALPRNAGDRGDDERRLV